MNRTSLPKLGHLAHNIKQSEKTSGQATCCRLSNLNSPDLRTCSLYTLSNNREFPES